MNDLIITPKGWIESFGEIAKFTTQVLGEVFRLRVFRFFGEALRQAGILIVGSALVICSLVFIVGLECGIEGAYLLRSPSPACSRPGVTCASSPRSRSAT